MFEGFAAGARPVQTSSVLKRLIQFAENGNLFAE